MTTPTQTPTAGQQRPDADAAPTDTELLNWFEANCWTITHYMSIEDKGWQVPNGPSFRTVREAIADAMKRGAK